MKYGAIATGSLEASQTAADILKYGGNAFDAAVGAIFVSMTSEFALTGAFGGGTLIGIHNNSSPFIYDFFVDSPVCNPNINAEFREISVNFGTTEQKFHVGKGSIAIPGNLLGLIEVHKNHGSLPLEIILSPAIDCALNGIIINKNQLEIIKLVEPILTFDKTGIELFKKNNTLISQNEKFTNPAFADFLQLVIKKGAKYFYEGPGLDVIINHCSNKSYLSKEDFKTYKVFKRKPVLLNYNQHDIYTNPSPSYGGSLIIFLLKLINDSNKKIELLDLIKGMNLASLARNEVCKNPHIENEINNIFKKNIYSRYLDLFNNGNHDFSKSINGFGSTTHVSILDKKGNAVSVTTTNGEGCGYIIPEFGIMMNNMLGEEDLNPFGYHKWGIRRRLPTMISPLIITKNNKPKYILGSGGSNRIRSANVQVILNLLNKKMSLKDAICEPRIHLEGNTLFCEPNINLPELNKININHFKNQNVFFGGVNAVSNKEAVGDERRGGNGVIC